jgi:hypothetical protein
MFIHVHFAQLYVNESNKFASCSNEPTYGMNHNEFMRFKVHNFTCTTFYVHWQHLNKPIIQYLCLILSKPE